MTAMMRSAARSGRGQSIIGNVSRLYSRKKTVRYWVQGELRGAADQRGAVGVRWKLFKVQVGSYRTTSYGSRTSTAPASSDPIRAPQMRSADLGRVNLETLPGCIHQKTGQILGSPRNIARRRR